MDRDMTHAQRNAILAKVKDGMDVIDVNGDKVGTVEFVRMAPEGTRIEDPTPPIDDGGVLGDFTEAITGAEGEVTTRMLQLGFVRIDASGWFTGRKYVEPEQIATVDADTVRLAIDKDDIGEPA